MRKSPTRSKTASRIDPDYEASQPPWRESQADRANILCPIRFLRYYRQRMRLRLMLDSAMHTIPGRLNARAQ